MDCIKGIIALTNSWTKNGGHKLVYILYVFISSQYPRFVLKNKACKTNSLIHFFVSGVEKCRVRGWTYQKGDLFSQQSNGKDVTALFASFTDSPQWIMGKPKERSNEWKTRTVLGRWG